MIREREISQPQRAKEAQEPLLKPVEAGRHAYDYMQRFKEGFLGTSQFLQAFQEKYPARGDENPFAQPFELYFPTGDHITYEPHNNESKLERLDVETFANPRNDIQGAVILVSWYEGQQESSRFSSGLLVHADKSNFSSNKSSTPRKVEDFYTAYFGKPQAQPPTEK